MARNDGIHRAVVRNAKISDGSIRKVQDHNEREKSTYSNQDIIPERSALNFHFKIPEDDYKKVFDKMVNDGEISVRGLRSDAVKFGELIFDVNSLYFYDHGGYDFAKRFYGEVYQAAIKIMGGEQYILSAVMHADERNRALSDSLGKNVFHYHLHVVYIPVVEKEIRWSRRCKNSALVGTVKDRVMQVSMSKKWASRPVLDEEGNPRKTKNGKAILKQSYSSLQDDFFEHMQSAGYTDIERGERGSSEEYLTITQFKVMKEQERLKEMNEHIRQKEFDLQRIDEIKAKPSVIGNRVAVDKNDFDMLVTGAKNYVVQEKKESFLQKTLDATNHLITELKNLVENLEQKLAEASKELMKFEFFRKENRKLESENDRLRAKIQAYDDVISQHDLSLYFSKEIAEKEEIEDEH